MWIFTMIFAVATVLGAALPRYRDALLLSGAGVLGLGFIAVVTLVGVARLIDVLLLAALTVSLGLTWGAGVFACGTERSLFSR
jgi:tetrahydromethanopterin S-methyltransferase subunit E